MNFFNWSFKRKRTDSETVPKRYSIQPESWGVNRTSYFLKLDSNKSFPAFNSILEEGMDIDSTTENDDRIMALPSTSSNSLDLHLPKIDDSNTNQSLKTPSKRFVSFLDQIDTRVEKLRKEAVDLQESKDRLLISIDLIKNHEHLQDMNENEREEISYYIQRVSSRLATVELSVKTVRDTAQEDSLHQVNVQIDSLITSGDPIMSRQRCQTYLNACSASDTTVNYIDPTSMNIDKKFENSLLGCTLDDQKNIKKRLQALITYLNKQIVSD